MPHFPISNVRKLKKMVIDSPPDPLFLPPCSRALAPAIPARISSRSTRRLVRSSFKKLLPPGHQLLACGPSLRFGPAGSPAACGGRSAYGRGEALARPPACGCNPNWKKTPAGQPPRTCYIASRWRRPPATVMRTPSAKPRRHLPQPFSAEPLNRGIPSSVKMISNVGYRKGPTES